MILDPFRHLWACLVAQTVKNLPAMQETGVWSLCQEDPLEKGMATHSRILAWRSPWTEELGRLQSMGLQRAGHDWATNTPDYCEKPWLCVAALQMSPPEKAGLKTQCSLCSRKYLGFCPTVFLVLRSLVKLNLKKINWKGDGAGEVPYQGLKWCSG